MKKKKENKKNFKVLLILLLVVLICLGFYFIKRNKNNQIQSPQTPQTTDVSPNGVLDYEYSIKNVTEKDGIQVTNMNFHVITDQVEITTTLKNKTNKPINGYYLEIDLLDKDNNVITTIASSIHEILEAKQTKDVVNYAIDVNNADKISSAKITYLVEDSPEQLTGVSTDNIEPEDVSTDGTIENSDDSLAE